MKIESNEQLAAIISDHLPCTEEYALDFGYATFRVVEYKIYKLIDK